MDISLLAMPWLIASYSTGSPSSSCEMIISWLESGLLRVTGQLLITRKSIALFWFKIHRSAGWFSFRDLYLKVKMMAFHWQFTDNGEFKKTIPLIWKHLGWELCISKWYLAEKFIVVDLDIKEWENRTQDRSSWRKTLRKNLKKRRGEA